MGMTRTKERKVIQKNFRLTQRVDDRLGRAADTKGLNEGEFIRLAVLRAIEATERLGTMSDGGGR